eukprot:15242342-Heterocapsa_arctica.AAC.1
MTTATTTAMTTTKIRVAAPARRDCGAWWRPVAPGGAGRARGAASALRSRAWRPVALAAQPCKLRL